jgi:hypothetical protein
METMKNEEILMWGMVAFVVAILSLVHALILRIRREEPRTFEALGSPHLFANNNIRTVWLFWVWLYSSASLLSGSGPSRLIAWLVRVLTLVYLVALGWLFLTHF